MEELVSTGVLVVVAIINLVTAYLAYSTRKTAQLIEINTNSLTHRLEAASLAQGKAEGKATEKAKK